MKAKDQSFFETMPAPARWKKTTLWSRAVRVLLPAVGLHMDVVHQSTGRYNSLGSMAVSPGPRGKCNMKTKHDAIGDSMFES